jgi:serine/threonine protein kinase
MSAPLPLADVEEEPEEPEEPITMEKFITQNDRIRFQWIHETDDNEEAGGTHHEHGARLQKHVKLNPYECNGQVPFSLSGKRLGRGRNTIVYRCFYAGTLYKRPLAVKVLNCIGEPEVPMEKALVEVEIMERLTHRHVVVYVASYEITIRGQYDEFDRRELGIVMYPPGICDLSTALSKISDQTHEQPPTRPDEEHLKRITHMFGYFGCLAQALRYIHTTDVLVKHKDIKPRNIIIDEFGQPIITDFGIAKRYAKKGEEVTTGGEVWTAEYAPPEAYEPQEVCGLRADVFSLGCVFMELVTVLLGGSLKELKEHIKHLNYHQSIAEAQTWMGEKLPDIIPPPGSGLDELLSKRSVSGISARQALLDTVPMIRRMVQRYANQRPHASELFETFLPLYDFTPKGCVCEGCKTQHGVPPTRADDLPPGLAERIASLPEVFIDEKDTHVPKAPDPESSDQQSSFSNSNEILHVEVEKFVSPRLSAQDVIVSRARPQFALRPASASTVRRLGQSRMGTISSTQPALKHRATTASLARQDTKERKILVFDPGRSGSRGPQVSIMDTSILNGRFNSPNMSPQTKRASQETTLVCR